jgi:hypothetical protein
VSKCLQKWLKTVPFLSAEIGDIFCPGKAANIEKSSILNKKVINFIGGISQNSLKKSRLVSKSAFEGLRPNLL